MKAFKRQRLESSDSFDSPPVKCFACHDTGVITNGDGFLNQFQEYKEYNINEFGSYIDGYDLPLVCCCAAAYPLYDENNAQSRGGFRSADKVNVTETFRGDKNIGVLVDQNVATALHKQRRESWRQTIVEMKNARIKAKENPNDIEALTLFMKLKREILQPETWQTTKIRCE